MRRGAYIETRRGQLSRHAGRRLRRFHFGIDQPPQGKNIKPADAAAFQRALLRTLERRAQAAYRGPVFLRLEFFNQSKTPPSIQKLPKNYLDLLETPLKGSGIPRAHLLYRNDRQVKGLVVRYHLTSPLGGPRVRVEAEPFRDFLADLALVRRVEADDFRDEDGFRAWGYDPGEFRDKLFADPDEGSDDDALDRLRELGREEAWWVRSVGRDAFEAHEALLRAEVQRGHLRRTDLFTCRGLLWLYRDTPPGRGALNRVLRIPRGWMLAPPFTLDLHHAPRREGDTDAFKTAVRSALEGYKRANRFLFPLSALLNVTILMVPPEGGGKDLDNLARLILPAVHEVLEPPSDLLRTLGPLDADDETVREELRALPKGPRHSITEYRAFEIPRHPDDPRGGFVRLAVGDGFMPVDFRGEIDSFLDGWREAVG